MTTVFSIKPLKQVHDINVTSKNSRTFVIDIFRGVRGKFDAQVVVYDPVSSTPGSWLFDVPHAGQTSGDIFVHSITFIQSYLAGVDATDHIVSVVNPCNDPFVCLAEQNFHLPGLAPGVVAVK